MRSIRGLAFASVSLLSLSAPAFAQDAEDNSDEAKDGIVVVGTLIRGTEVTGSQTLSVDAADIAQKGAVSTGELLSLVPQISNAFNGRFEVDPRGVGTGLSINRPNLRNLPGANSASGGTALVLVDGFRMAPLGVNQSALDVDVLPAAVIAGMDIVTDGGSSLYGADAVSGVINFRTMRKFDGLKVDFNYGKGDTIKGYSYWDGALTAGKSWATGNAWISAAYSKRESVLNNETTWYDPRSTTPLASAASPVPSATPRSRPSAAGSVLVPVRPSSPTTQPLRARAPSRSARVAMPSAKLPILPK